MPTSRPAPERTVKIYNWEVNELENDNGYEFITPQGYIFGFGTKESLLDWMADISWNAKVYRTCYGDIHEVRDYIIRAWQPDPWINKDWKLEDKICSVGQFMDTATEYIKRQWL